MKVFDNIERAANYKEDLRRVINDLIPLRNDKGATTAYYENFIETDLVHKRWAEEAKNSELNGVMNLNPQYQGGFKLLPGAIEPDKAAAFRSELLSVISDDKYAFGYLYHLLGSEKNREASFVLYRCVIPCDEIMYAIEFDIDEVVRVIEIANDLKEKYEIAAKWRRESDRALYTGELKNRFNECMDNYLNNIEKEIQLFGYTKPNLKRLESLPVMPAEINTDEARGLFQKAIEAGLMEQTATGYKWRYPEHKPSNVLLAYFCGKIYCGDHLKNNSVDRRKLDWVFGQNEMFPDTALNKLFGVKNLGQSRQQKKDGTPPIGYEIIDELFKSIRQPQ